MRRKLTMHMANVGFSSREATKIHAQNLPAARLGEVKKEHYEFLTKNQVPRLGREKIEALTVKAYREVRVCEVNAKRGTVTVHSLPMSVKHM